MEHRTLREYSGLYRVNFIPYKYLLSLTYWIGGTLALAIIGLLILIWFSFSQEKEAPCVIIATINDVKIFQSEVDFMQAQLILQGGSEDQYSAMLEVLWQENERQRRKLIPAPTRADARRIAVRRLRHERLSNHTNPQLKLGNIPQNTQFTDCGLNIISKEAYNRVFQ